VDDVRDPSVEWGLVRVYSVKPLLGLILRLLIGVDPSVSVLSRVGTGSSPLIVVSEFCHLEAKVQLVLSLPGVLEGSLLVDQEGFRVLLHQQPVHLGLLGLRFKVHKANGKHEPGSPPHMKHR